MYIEDKKVKFEAPINMSYKDIENVNNLSINYELNINNKQIKGLGDGNQDADAVNVKQLNGMETNITNYVNSEIGKVNPVLSNNSDLIKFIYYMEESVLLGTKPLVDSIRHFIRDPSGVFSVCHLCECRIVQ